MNRAPIGAIVCSGVSTKRLTRRAMSIVFLFVVLAGTLLFASPPAALAQDPTPITIEAEVGFNGKARVGHWIPVAVQLENQGGDFTGEVHVLGTGGRSDRVHCRHSSPNQQPEASNPVCALSESQRQA